MHFATQLVGTTLKIIPDQIKYQQAPDPETVRENARAAAERRLQEQNLLDVPGNKPKLLRCPMSPRPGRNQIELSDARAWN